MSEYDDDDFDGEPKFPSGVMFAGVIWIVFGALGLISTIVQIGMAGAGGAGGPKTGAAPVGCCGVVFALAFLVVGVQTFKGTAKDTRGNGIGSIVFSLIYFAIAAVLIAVGIPGGQGAPVGTEVVISAIVLGGMGLMLLIAGVMALMGRAQYKAWRTSAGLDSPKRSRRRRDDDDDDDRPRRRKQRRDDDDDDLDRPRIRRERDDD